MDHARGTEIRLRIFFVVLAVVAVILGVRLAYWQVVRGPELRAAAVSQLARPVEIPAIRGSIRDRNGAILAITAYRDRLVAYPKLIPEEERAEAARTLGTILELSPSAALALEEDLVAGGEYVLVDRAIDEEASQAIRAAIEEGRIDGAGIGLEPQPFRVYPLSGGEPGTTLASRLLGFVSSEGKGSYGVEQSWDATLAGSPTIVEASRDPFGRPLGSSARVIEAGAAGADVTLTIDAALQLRLEKELYTAWVADKAKRVSGVILDPESGAVLAWATVPGYDANDYAAAWSRDPSLFIDPIAGLVYEPGSVMKMLTAAAALESRRIRPGTPIYDAPKLEFDPYTVRNADHEGMGRIPFRDVIAYSRNVGTARVAARLGRTTERAAETLHAMWDRLGIGRTTGIGLSGESAGIAADPAKRPWAEIDLANRSFGQSVLVTQVQLAAAFAPMVNGGMRVEPHLVTAVGETASERPAPARALPAGVAGQLRAMLDHVTGAVPWYAEGSLIPGYLVGGKTGTAQIWRQAKGHYSKDVFNFSFVGYVGGDTPEAVVALRIEEARAFSPEQGQIEIAMTSYELFRRVALGVIDVLAIPRSEIPGAGFPEPLSEADRELTPNRYLNHRAELARGLDPRIAFWNRYLPAGALESGEVAENGEGVLTEIDARESEGSGAETASRRSRDDGRDRGRERGRDRGAAGGDAGAPASPAPEGRP